MNCKLLNKLINPKYTISKLFVDIYYIYYESIYLGCIYYQSQHVKLTTIKPCTTLHAIHYNDPEYQDKMNGLIDQSLAAVRVDWKMN